MDEDEDFDFDGIDEAPFDSDDGEEQSPAQDFEDPPHTSKTPYTRLWKVRFFGDKDDVFEEYNAEELAKHLSTAHDTGARGPAPEAGNEQLTAIPAARITGGAAAEGGGRQRRQRVGGGKVPNAPCEHRKLISGNKLATFFK